MRPAERPAERYAICLECEEFRRWAKQCRVCKCIMPIKVRIPSMACPLGKWLPVEDMDL